MKTVNLLLASILVAGCATSNTTNVNDVSIANANQHIAMAVTLAKFYCDNSRWPETLDEAEYYSNEAKIPMPTSINWSFIRNSKAMIRGQPKDY